MTADTPRGRRATLLAASALALTIVFASARAGADGHVYTANNDKWKAECGSCHIAYPPQLLPQSSWRSVMDGLEKHFGTDASLDPATTAEIAAFLDRNAGRERRTRDGTTALRITDTRWFEHEHDELAPSIWKSPQVKTASNCIACHTKADIGNFNEQTLRVPK